MREPRWPSKAEIHFTETGGLIKARVIVASSGQILATFERASPKEVVAEMQSLGRLHDCSLIPTGPKPPRMKEYLEKGAAELRAEIEARGKKDREEI